MVRPHPAMIAALAAAAGLLSGGPEVGAAERGAARVPVLLWERTFGGKRIDRADAITVLPGGDLVFAGHTTSKGVGGSHDVWVVRLDGRGSKVWDRTFGGKYSETGWAIVALGDGGVAVAAQRSSFADRGNDGVWLLRLDRRGRRLWDRVFREENYTRSPAMAALPGGRLAVVVVDPRIYDARLLLIGARGKVVGTHALGSLGNWPLAVAALRDGGVVVAGSRERKATRNADVWVIRLDRRGKVLWERTFGGAGDDSAHAVIELPDGGLAVTGSTESKGAGESDVWLLRLDRRGNLLWDRTYGGPDLDNGGGIMALKDGGFVIGAQTTSKGAGNWDAWVLRLDRAGKLLWDRTYGGGKTDLVKAMVALPGGGFAIAGLTDSKGAGGDEAWVLRFGFGKPKRR